MYGVRYLDLTLILSYVMKFYMADIIVFFYAREGSCLIYFILMSLWSKWWDIYHWRETIDICFQLLKQTVSASNWWWIEEMLKANCITTEGSLCKSNRQKISLAHLRNVFKKKKKFTIINLWWTIVNLAWYQTQKIKIKNLLKEWYALAIKQLYCLNDPHIWAACSMH